MSPFPVSITCGLLLLLLNIYHTTCSQQPVEDRMLRIKFEFDPTLPRLGNIGEPEPLPDGHGGQQPQFGRMSVHWIELVPTIYTRIGEGEVIYSGPQTREGVIDHSQAIIVEEGVFWLNISLQSISAGTYPWIRTSVAYQEYTARFNLINNIDEYYATTYNLQSGYTQISETESGTGYIQSFLGVNTAIGTIINQNFTLEVNAEKLQGFWTFVTEFDNSLLNDQQTIQYGDGARNATTVPNPLWATTKTPPGSCIVVGTFPDGELVIPDDTENNDDTLPDIGLVLRYSVNQSFEYVDKNGNGELDWYYLMDEQGNTKAELIANLSDEIVDMGTRGLWPYTIDVEREYMDIVDVVTTEDKGEMDDGYQLKSYLAVCLMFVCAAFIQ